jgi:hypothetical protein
MSFCERCGKECKDKRGLTLHVKKCDGKKPNQCEFCSEEFANQYSLAVHLTRCKVVKAQNKEKEDIAKEEMIKKLVHKEEENKQLRDLLKEMEIKYHKDITDIKTSFRLNYEQQIKIRDNDVSSYHIEIQTLLRELKDKEQQIDDLKEVNKSLQIDNRTLVNTISTLSLKDTNTTIINQHNNDNRIQLQCFESSMIQGRINPPDYTIGSVDDLVRMLRSLGVRNCFRVNDKSRGTISWHKPGEGEIRDPNAEQFLTHVIDSLNTDLIKEKSYYEEELKTLCNAEDLDMYQIDESRGFVTFCSELLKKKPETLKKIKRELIKQGKSKNDAEMDQVHEVTYNKFVTSIIMALFPCIMSWCEQTFYEIGRFLGSKIKDYYHIEGASREKLYIVIHSDNNGNKRINATKMIPFISEAFNSVIDSELVYRIIREFILYKSLNQEKAESIVKYIQNPTLQETKELMRGIVSL